MKSAILIMLLTLLAGYSHAQRVLLSGDTERQITIDSTGYAVEHPQDIFEEAGLFIYSKDGREAIRIYGSFHLFSVSDNRKNFHAFDLIQAGVDDFY